MCEYSTAARKRSMSFLRCRLHGHRLVDGLPPACPYANEHPQDVLARLQDRAWAAAADLDLDEFLALRERFETCFKCRLPVDVLGRLRRAAGAAFPVATAPASG